MTREWADIVISVVICVMISSIVSIFCWLGWTVTDAAYQKELQTTCIQNHGDWTADGCKTSGTR